MVLKSAILTIGDEICIGQVVNTNASWIGTQCSQAGISVLTHLIVGDDIDMIVSEADRLLNISDIVIATGGLGPTHDDITKKALCELFDDELVMHQETLQFVEELSRKRGIVLLERNKAQALVPSKCKVLSNGLGSAPGLLFKRNNKYLISLPGVPREMMNIMENHVIPFMKKLIKERKSDLVAYKNLQFAGIPESVLAELLGEPSEFLDGGSLAFLPSYKGLRLRIGTTADSFQNAEKKLLKIESYIREKAGKYIFGEEDDTLSEIVGKMLKGQGKTISVAESCTGGLLGAEFTEISGSSGYFTGGAIVYSNEAKHNILGIDSSIIDSYGAVSKETAEEMAKKVRKLFKTDFGTGITGIAGPTGGTEEKPVGTVWIAVSDEKETKSQKFFFGSDRKTNRERAVASALLLLYKQLKKK